LPHASILSFLPSAGAGSEEDQPIPPHWDDLDFSWMLQSEGRGGDAQDGTVGTETSVPIDETDLVDQPMQEHL
jgi:hypothetical protein